jgi:hypothetical protein
MRKLFVIFLLVVSIPVFAKDAVTGIYTNMSFNSQSGDVSGIELFIVFTKEGYKGIFQDVDGVLNVPIVVPMKIDKSEVSFELPDREGYVGKFTGKILKGKIVGRFSAGQISADGSEAIVLIKKKSYWQ